MIKGNRVLNYSVIQVYTDNIKDILQLEKDVDILSKNKKYIPVFYKEFDYKIYKKPFIVRCDNLQYIDNPLLHHFHYNIKNNYDIQSILDIDRIQKMVICFYATTKKHRDDFLFLKHRLINSSIYISLDENNKPDYSLVKDLFTEMQYINIDGEEKDKYYTTYMFNRKIKQCNISKYILYYDGKYKFCPESNKKYSLIEILLKKNDKCDRDNCKPYLLEYGEKN